MKVLFKNNYAFATGLFWQIADDGKRLPNFKRLTKDTGHDLFCHVKSSCPTWGFGCRDELHGTKQVASLGKYIILASDLLLATDNTIVIYKFKSVGELDENDLPLKEDLYGYVILLNGTICPDEGEYVSNFNSVKESILYQAHRYKIQCLHLTVDVAIKFFNIYQLLNDYYHTSQILLDKLISIINEDQLAEIQNLGFDVNDINNTDKLNEFIKSEQFQKEYKRIRDIELPFLFEYIQIKPYLSEEIYWKDSRIKQFHKQSILRLLKNQANNKIKLIIVILLFATLLYLTYSVFFREDENVPVFLVQQPELPKIVSVNPAQLIEKCIIKNDRYFVDLESWTLKSLKCDCLSNTLIFEANTRLTFNDFAALIGESDGVIFSNQLGEYKDKYWIKNKSLINQSQVSHGQILTNLEKSAIDYSFNLQIQNRFDKSQTFIINSNLSPVFLLRHHVFDYVLLKDIQMTLNPNDGLYTWIINGEFK